MSAKRRVKVDANANFGSLRKEFAYRRQVALKSGHHEIANRLAGFLDWMESVPVIARLLATLDSSGRARELMYHQYSKGGDWYRRDKINARSIDDIAAVGLALINHTEDHSEELRQAGQSFGVYSEKWNATPQADCDTIVARYIVPLLDWVEQRLPEEDERPALKAVNTPPVIFESLKKFRAQHRSVGARCFIMMRFAGTRAHKDIEKAVKETLRKHGLVGVLARDKEFHEDLFPNILTYMHGCDFGIAVFERLETEVFNPNVALEVGYMLGLRKQVLLLKDRTLRALHTDLVGKLYREFDPQAPKATIPKEIDSWLSDKGIA